MKNGRISEFDKVYIVKYIEIIGKRQVAEDLQITREQLENIINELKKNGLYEIYYNLSDEEWEGIAKMKRVDILRKYLPQSEKNNLKAVQELLKVFELNISDTIMKFPLYNYTEQEFKFDYFKQGNHQNEEWKQIEKLNYLVSNYGRIKNSKTNKLKSLRNNRFGYQINLWNNGKAIMITISRLVAHYFIRPVNSDERVKHIDGRIRNNYYKNLEIVSK